MTAWHGSSQNTFPIIFPEKPTIIVENMTGASSIIAANYIYNIARPDGMTIGAPATGDSYCPNIESGGRQV